MSHDYHEGQPGYHPDQVLYDGCRECKARAASEDRGVSSLDTARFAGAMDRARQWEARGLANISEAEMPLLSVLASVSRQIEAARCAGVMS